MRMEVTQLSLCSVPPRVQPFGGREEGPRVVRQQRAARHGRVSAPRPAVSEPESAASSEHPRPLGTLGVLGCPFMAGSSLAWHKT